LIYRCVSTEISTTAYVIEIRDGDVDGDGIGDERCREDVVGINGVSVG